MYFSCKITFFIGFRTAGLSSDGLVLNLENGFFRAEELPLRLPREAEFIQLSGVPGESSIVRHLVSFQKLRSGQPLELGQCGNASATNASLSSVLLDSSV